MYPVLLPSLKQMASVKIAIYLYKDRDIQNIIYALEHHNFGFEINRAEIEAWKEIRKIASKKLPKYVPESLKTTIVELIRPIHIGFFLWMQDHYSPLKYANPDTYLQLVSWKSEGTIDRISTATNFIQSPGNPLGRFLMACYYFRPNDVLALWEEMEDKDIDLGNYNMVVRFWQKWRKKRAIVPWKKLFNSHFAKVEIRRYEDNPTRIDSFFDNLLEKRKSIYVMLLGTKMVHQDDLRQYLYRCNETDRNEFFHRNAEKILLSLLHWPFQSFFLDMANQLWNHMGVDTFASILYHIFYHYIRKDFKFFDYIELFRTFWLDSPDCYKVEIKTKPIFNSVHALYHFNGITYSLTVQDIVRMYT